ncbi:hypothetical protein SKAU_G00369370 [Synaphobranchus kaupii]|uniref:Secreted protein n=1 Tax=Synaphobranchus kaupii TaxID=118154 RepID=A0A9Q1EFQ4_SYNKA|nr:hypothetical protein SKAU_G00369370 [Synaphobranchus kaupii]
MLFLVTGSSLRVVSAARVEPPRQRFVCHHAIAVALPFERAVGHRTPRSSGSKASPEISALLPLRDGHA